MSAGARGKWAKQNRKQNKAIVLKYIKEKQPIQYRDLKKLVPFSDPTLSNYLRELVTDGFIEWHEDSEDRRIKWYIIKAKEKADLQIQKYDDINFIENLPNPVYSYTQLGKCSVSAFIGPVTSKIQRKVASVAMNRIVKLATSELTKKQEILNRLIPGQEVAIIFTVKG
jgi:DNA-binding MarR family transcriptional regulator